MRFGEQEIQVGELDAEKTVKLIKFVSHVYSEMQQDQQDAVGEELKKGGFAAFINILSPQHLYDLMSIVLGVSHKEAKEHWTLSNFTEMVGELAEHNDLSALIKNLQRVAGAFRS
jgi:hypothetical protein